MPLPAQNFVDKIGPVISAAWLNEVDAIRLGIMPASTFPNGTANAPGIGFTTTPGLGFYVAAANTLGIATNGLGRVTVNGSGAVAIAAPGAGAALTIVGNAAAPMLDLSIPSTGADYIRLVSSNTNFVGISLNVSTGHIFALRVSGTGLFLSDTTNGNNPISINNNGQVSIVGATVGSNLLIGSSSAITALSLSNVTATATQTYLDCSNGTDANFDIKVSGVGAALKGGFIGSTVGGVPLFLGGLIANSPVAAPNITTTASAANAFFDGANSNNFLRSTSSLRYKTAVEDLPAEVAEQLFRLRPVKYQSLCAADDPYDDWYGLIAEEVAEINPRLCHFDAEGRPDGVQYDRIPILLLVEVQKLRREVNELRGIDENQVGSRARERGEDSGDTRGAVRPGSVLVDNGSTGDSTPKTDGEPDSGVQ